MGLKQFIDILMYILNLCINLGVGRSADLHSISIGDATTLYSAKNLIRERIIEWVDVIDDEVEIEDENIEEIETLIIRAGRKPRAGQTIFKT